MMQFSACENGISNYSSRIYNCETLIMAEKRNIDETSTFYLFFPHN